MPTPSPPQNALSAVMMRMLLQRTDVQRELELSDEQNNALKAIFKAGVGDWQNAAQYTMQPPPNRPAPRNPDSLVEKRRAAVLEVEQQYARQIEAILLPHQLRRLKQIYRQFRVGGMLFLTFMGSEVDEDLGISPEQRKVLEARAKELRQELQEKIRQANQAATEEMMQLLTPDQRQRFTELVGETFQFEQAIGR
jgi:hypothetical protein